VLATGLRALSLPAPLRPTTRLETYLAYYNHDRTHHGRLTRGHIPNIIYAARKMEAR
jgi:hypothetical protein